eukprot:TRINITY_DN395_c3_g1_i2.p1 TRINITY_DN395_c3_g1~~TRINITY_DN395_c3_g1_i2.p1  ORF type:complete len:527 (-),score=62.95 TRINITY_DN395_c3_g1_i2:375-1955(-)
MMGEGGQYRDENHTSNLENGLIKEYSQILYELSQKGNNTKQDQQRRNGGFAQSFLEQKQFQQVMKRTKKERSPEDKCAIQLATTFFWCVSIGLLICSYQIRNGDMFRRQQLQSQIMQMAENGTLAYRQDIIQDQDIDSIVPQGVLEQIQFQGNFFINLSLLQDADIDESDYIIPKIEFELEGNYVYLDRSFDLSTVGSNVENSGNDEYTEQFEVDQSSVRMFLGVTSECCLETSVQRRTGVRQSWFKVVQQHPNVDAKFILSQPDPDKVRLAQALKSISEEIVSQASSNESGIYKSTDIVVVPGKDTYFNLPNKTIRLFTYALSSSRNFTHILKTDDDCYVRVHQLFDSVRHRFQDVYMGCVESPYGFMPVRNPDSKWYLSNERLPDKYVPWGTRYVAGWGYLLSRDVASFFLQHVWMFRRNPDIAPKWFAPLDWEDVLVGLVLSDKLDVPDDHPGFKAGWSACTNQTLVKHLDFDSPLLLPGLYQQDISKLWDNKTVQCNTGLFPLGNYWEWYLYRQSLKDVQKI